MSRNPEPKTQQELVSEIRDLSGRLYYCSNGGEGRKMRKWLEQRIKKLDKELEEQQQ